MLAKYLVEAGLVSPNELDAAQMLVRSSMARGTALAVGDALVELRIVSAPVLMALTFLYQLDQTSSSTTAATLERHLVQSGAITAEEFTSARAAQAQALTRGRLLSLGTVLVRTCHVTRQVLDQRLSPPATAETSNAA
jgi:hypothetical protein